jgi:hypothetical protein
MAEGHRLATAAVTRHAGWRRPARDGLTLARRQTELSRSHTRGDEAQASLGERAIDVGLSQLGRGGSSGNRRTRAPARLGAWRLNSWRPLARRGSVLYTYGVILTTAKNRGQNV